MTRASSGGKKSGPPAHPNKFAYIHNRNSRLTKHILSTPISGLCPPCQSILEWRKKFRKYKPLTVAKKCVKCGERTVREAYHVVCDGCAGSDGVCAKCLVVRKEGEDEETKIMSPEELAEAAAEEEESENELDN